MNNAILNAELALAVRKCLPFVRKHAIVSGGDGSITYAFAVRTLADYDARRVQEQAVKNVAEAEYQRQRYFAASAADAKIKAARAVRTDYIPTTSPAKRCECDLCTQYRRRFNLTQPKGTQA